jgi:GGDEF domain-containing protein
MHHYIIHLLLIFTIAYLSYDPSLGMLNRNGGRLLILILALPLLLFGGYTLVFADVDRLKQLNKATGNHFATNRLLRAGFRVRFGELAWQIYGDEFAFLIRGNGHAFCTRIARQLAKQDLTSEQRQALADINGCTIEEAKLSATYSVYENVRWIWQALEYCSQDVLQQKAIRDAQ